MLSRSQDFIYTLKRGRRAHFLGQRPASMPNLFPQLAPDYAAYTSHCPLGITDWKDFDAPINFPPFQADRPTLPPRVCIWHHLQKPDFRTFELCNYNKEKVFQIFELKFCDDGRGSTKRILFELLYEVLRYCRVHTFTIQKTSALFSIFYYTHDYFRASLWRTAEETYCYFKEAILLHTVQRPPKSAEIFEPIECREALLFFCKVYLRHLPLIHLTTMPVYSLQLRWTPDPDLKKEESEAMG